MQLLFKQRFFSWFDSYDIYGEDSRVIYVVNGQLSWGHCLKIFDTRGVEVGMVKQRILTFLPAFELYNREDHIGCIRRKFTLFRPQYMIDRLGWVAQGDFMEWQYTIRNLRGDLIATVSKQLFNWTDTYSINVYDPRNALYALMFVLAIDAEKCSRN